MINFIGNKPLIESQLYKMSSIEDCIAWLNTLEEVNLDTETTGLFNHNNKVVMLQLEFKGIEYVIDTRITNISKLSRLENILIVGQNLKFDYKFMKFHGITFSKVYDTMLAEAVLTTGLSKRSLGLAGLALKYCNKDMSKQAQTSFIDMKDEPFTDEQIIYGIEDVNLLSKIKSKQIDKINQLDLNNLLDLENKSILALADIEYNGFRLDVEAWTKLYVQAEANTSIYEEDLANMVRNTSKLSSFVKTKLQGNLFAEVEEGYNHESDIQIKWSSPLQMKNVFNSLGLNIESTSEKEISKYQKDYPFVKKFIDYKKNSKLITTYGREFLNYINPYTKKVHTDFWPILNTGRVSSGSKDKRTGKKIAPNMQNIPANNSYRNCFIPDKGNKIVSCDFSGQELRLVAFVSQEPTWLDAFNTGKDLHSEVAASTFNIPIEQVREYPEFLRGKSYRDVAKTINFGLVYGMSEFKLSSTLNIPVKEAKDMIDKYFEKAPKLCNFLKVASSYGVKNLMIRSCKPFRRIRFFDPPEGDSKRIGGIERESKNAVIQMSGADMCKLALVRIREYIINNKLEDKVKIIMTVHDQIDCEVKSDYAEEWSLIQKQLMEEAGKVIIKDLPVLSDITIADVWTK